MDTTQDKLYAAGSISCARSISQEESETINNSNVQYSFGDFVLSSTRILFHKDKRLSISPKELGVLNLLVSSAGELVTKSQMIHEVWYDGNVGEESLTRCIYVLRRILQEGKNERFIDTVYGKGYRFAIPVTRIAAVANTGDARCVFAVFPFRLAGDANSLGLQDAIVQQLAGCASLGLQVLPSSLTLNCRTTESTLELLEKVRPHYYLTGYELTMDGAPSIRIELIRAHDHRVLHRECIDRGMLNEGDYFSRRLKEMIMQTVPGLARGNKLTTAEQTITPVA